MPRMRSGLLRPARVSRRDASALLVGEYGPAVLDEERMVVVLVGICGVVGLLGGSIRDVFFGIDSSHGTHVGLIAGGARRALLGVYVQEAVAEQGDRLRIRSVGVLDHPAAGLVLGEHDVARGIELVD